VPTLHRPASETLADLADEWRGRPLSYEVGLLDRPLDRRRWFRDRAATVVGQGDEDFAAACDAIRGWVKFQQTWTVAARPLAPIETGAIVGYSARVVGLWWSYCCEILEVIDDETTGVRRFGFVYGTLRGHAERGEESFIVTHDRATDEVRFAITAASRPGRWFTWCGLPVARWAQTRFRAGATRAMADDIAARRATGRHL
jgi:uncharacterized protein (UPF0548 family)